jgi:hypothetical protein
MERAAIVAALDAALVSAEGFAPGDWVGMADPFPLWKAA